MDEPIGATHVWTVGNAKFHARISSPGWDIWQNSEWIWIGDDISGDISPNENGVARNKFAEELFNHVNPDCKWHKQSEELKELYRSAFDAGYRKQ